MELDAISVVGPTASGKTCRAVSLARLFEGEIISADSRQVYRGMTIGTGKDLCEYGDIPYHLIDIADAGTKYNLHRYLKDFNKAYDSIRKRNRMPIICGGTGMYIETALNGIRLPDVPENTELRNFLADKSLEELEKILRTYKTLHNVTDIDTTKRAIRAIEIEEYYINNPDQRLNTRKETANPINTLVIGIDIPRECRRQRITRRLHSRLEDGMIDEVKGLISQGVNPEDLIYYGLEYKYLTLYILGKLGYEEMVRDLETAIHQFAKRQMTWFRGMEKRGTKINWIPWDLSESDFFHRVNMLLKDSSFHLHE